MSHWERHGPEGGELMPAAKKKAAKKATKKSAKKGAKKK
jgi:hypothetical protein